MIYLFLYLLIGALFTWFSFSRQHVKQFRENFLATEGEKRTRRCFLLAMTISCLLWPYIAVQYFLLKVLGYNNVRL